MASKASTVLPIAPRNKSHETHSAKVRLFLYRWLYDRRDGGQPSFSRLVAGTFALPASCIPSMLPDGCCLPTGLLLPACSGLLRCTGGRNCMLRRSPSSFRALLWHRRWRRGYDADEQRADDVIRRGDL